MLELACNIEYCVCKCKCEKGDLYYMFDKDSGEDSLSLYLFHLTDLEECKAVYLNLKV